MKRRQFVKRSALTAVGVSAAGSIHWNGKSYAGDTPTTTDILGPFYRPNSPLRSDLVPADSTGEVLHFSGTILQKDGKTPLANALVESWQCDENEIYDNTSDEYRFRGSQKTSGDGKYAFRTMVPIPYNDAGTWRPAHIHLRVSSEDHQDLITQLYLTGDRHLKDDITASLPQAKSRILQLDTNAKGEKTLNFDVVMGTPLALEDAAYEKLVGIYQVENGLMEFYRTDDLLMLKHNGQILEGLRYKGNNTFEGAFGSYRAKFDLEEGGVVKCEITIDNYPNHKQWARTFKGVKAFKY